MTDETQPRAPRTDARARRTLALIAAVAIAPMLASYTIYYLFPREAGVNYGTLLPTAPAPAIAGTASDGTPFRLEDLRGRWVLIAGGEAGCDSACERSLYATQQARAMQGKDQDRIVRVWLDAGGGAIASERLAAMRGLTVARVPPAALAALPQAGRGIVLIDPLGNVVLAYPADPDIKGLAKDLARVLRASGIG
jgi:hypothetical protein